MNQSLSRRTFVGFGFGAIQTGLFLWEAQQSGHFDRLLVAMTNESVVRDLRRSKGTYRFNVATPTAREVCEVRHVEIYNPADPADRDALADAVAEASELSTALPSVENYEQPGAAAADILAEGIRRKLRRSAPVRAILYAAENHNHAAEILDAAVRRRLTPREAAECGAVFQALNTVIGKMSRVVRDEAEIREAALVPFVDRSARAYLVEEFNHILISRVTLPGFQRGIAVFQEKADLLPFEEAKLYGHNAAHALLGYLAQRRGLRFMTQARNDSALMKLVRDAFLEESGSPLIARHSGKDSIFTPDGYRAYADDLLERMTNPWLRDDVDRITRDPRRKLGWDDRLVGTMRLALAAGIEPCRFAIGTAAALELLHQQEPGYTKRRWLEKLWAEAAATTEEKARITERILSTKP